MPACVDCGTEADRAEMFGPPDELRCSACVAKLRERLDQVYAPVRGTAEPGRPLVTYALIGLAVVLTLGFWAQAPFVFLYLLETPATIWDGELWRFVTATFLHVNPIHLLFNLYWLWKFGFVTENWMGSARFLGFFLLAALGSSAAQFLLDRGGIGLSGVGYALFGLLYALRHDKDFAAALMQQGLVELFVGWFFLGIVLTLANVMAIGNVAHGAGAVIGWLMGQAVLRRQRVLLVSGLSILVLALTASTLYMPWNGQWAYHQGVRALRARDLAAAQYWFRRAAELSPDDMMLQEWARQFEAFQQQPGKPAP